MVLNDLSNGAWVPTIVLNGCPHGAEWLPTSAGVMPNGVACLPKGANDDEGIPNDATWLPKC